MYELIIVGGGPAGITAGIYATRQKLNTLLITKDFGGQIAKKAVTIENFPGFEEISGMDLIQKLESHLKKQEIKIERKEVIKIEKVEDTFFVYTKENDKFEARTVIIASGADPRPLDVVGEKEFIGKGVSYCSLCDGPIFSGKDVAIIGGGNSAFETASFLSNIVNKIYILEYGSEARADKENQEAVRKAGKTEVITRAALREIRGDKFVNSIVYQNRETKEEKILPVEGVFVQIGLLPATSFIKDLNILNNKNEVEIEIETCQTKIPGLFAAGDVNMGQFKQIITACGEGAKSALAAFNYLKKLER